MSFLRLIPDEHKPAHISASATAQSLTDIQFPDGTGKISPNTTRAGATHTKFLVLTPESKFAKQTMLKSVLTGNDVAVDKNGVKMEAAEQRGTEWS